MTLTIRWNGLEKLLRDLRKGKETAVPYAIKTALNSQAYEAQRLWRGEIRQQFTTRNQFTERSVMVVRAAGTGEAIQASVGSTAPYMGFQEEGGVSKGRAGLKGIPGPSAAGQAPGSRRTRLVRSGNRLGAISVAHPQLKGSKKQRNAIAIAMAVKQGKKVALLERARGGKALFSIAWSGRHRAGRAIKFRLLWDFSHSGAHVPPHATLQRALTALGPKVPSMMQAAVIDQFRRHHLFGY